MKKLFVRLIATLCVATFILPLCVAKADEPNFEISAQSTVLISADTGVVLYEKDAYSQRSMASTTKIMTALLALERAETDTEPIEITEETVAVEGSSMGLQAGDKITLENLAVGMLLASGNDAANAVALHFDGSIEKFAERMNSRAAEIGLKDTNFVTPSGLDDSEHYSTAYDMALLTRTAMKNSEFRRLCSSQSFQVEFAEPAKKVTYTNHNKLLWLYDGCVGVKTGFTKKSGRCLVSAAERNGIMLIAVTLNAPDDWNDHMKMFDYGFSSVKSISLGEDFTAELSVVGSDKEKISVCGGVVGNVCVSAKDADKITCRVLLPEFFYAPVKKGERVGSLQYYLGESPIYSIPICADESAEPDVNKPNLFEKIFRRK